MNVQMMSKLLHNLGQLRKHEQWTRAQLEAYQSEALNRLRQYAYKHSPFYQRFHKGLTDRSLHELPVLTKAMMMEHFDELVTDRATHLEEVRAHAAMLPDSDWDRIWSAGFRHSSQRIIAGCYAHPLPAIAHHDDGLHARPSSA